MTNSEFMLSLARQKLDELIHDVKLVGDNFEEYEDRLNLEFDLIDGSGYTDYFLIIWDIMRWSRENGIMTGPGRGSVGGSLLAYLLQITTVDPMRFDLLFERFMNPARAKFDPPDVDLDFQTSRRGEVKEYIIEKYGENHVASIGTRSFAYASNSIKDVAKIMDLNFQELNNATSNRLGESLEKAYEEVDTFQKWVDKTPANRKCFETAKRIEGMIRHRGVHPGGIVIAPVPIANLVPLSQNKEVIATQWDMDEVQKRGLLKIDVLASVILDVIHDTVKGFHRFDPSSLEWIPLDDKDVLDKFNTTNNVGIFQFEANHLNEVVKKMTVEKFDDLVIATTICRPGCTSIGVTDSFVRRRAGKEEVEYPHPSVGGLLKDTQGYPIYQELIMKLSSEGSGGELTTADAESIRYAIKHKDEEAMNAFEKRFIGGALSNLNATEEQARGMWEMIQASSGYSFNKSHAVAYSLISYQCQYFKHHYPTEFMCASLRHAKDSKGVAVLLNECKRMGIEVEPVGINESKQSFCVQDGKIFCGFSMVKNVGDKAADEIVENQPFSGIEEFKEKVNKRIVNKRIRENLDKAGAFGVVENFSDYLEMYGNVLVGGLPDWDLDNKLPNCRECGLCESRFQVVKGNGNQKADVMIIGEAPGQTEDRRGIPFVGQSGKMLRHEWLPAVGLDANDCYISNVVKCIPLDDKSKIRPPTDEEKAVCSIWLDLEIQRVKPKVIIALGGQALDALSSHGGITKMNGKSFEVQTIHNYHAGVTGFALFHPAYILRNHSDMTPTLKKLEALIQSIGDDTPFY